MVVVKGVSSVAVLVGVYLTMFVWDFLDNGGKRGGLFFVLGSNGVGIFGGSGGRSGGFWSNVAPSNVGIAVAVTAMAGLALAATVVYTRRGTLRSPWSLHKRKRALLPHQWKKLFTPDGKLRDGGVKFLKKVRSGGVDPSIRAEVWPFLLGVYDLTTTQEERDSILTQKRKEYEKLRKQCRRLLKRIYDSSKLKETNSDEDIVTVVQDSDSPNSNDTSGEKKSFSAELENPTSDYLDHQDIPHPSQSDDNQSGVTSVEASVVDSESSDSDSEEPEDLQNTAASDEKKPDKLPVKEDATSASGTGEVSKLHRDEDFETWQRIIRLDAVRTNGEWIVYSPSQAGVLEDKAHSLAEAVGLKDYDHLEPCRVFHAARLVAILEAYALYDEEIGYCQGMSDLLSPIVAIIEDNSIAFWCFVGFMKKARHNFRLDEVGIRRQLNLVSKIIKFKDSHLYRHLEKLQAEDCFFVYRMVVVLFRRELTFEQTVCLWEVMWADQAAVRAGIGENSSWGKIRQKAPPTEDLLLYAIAACVLERRKLIIEMYSSMDEIIRECNSMAGHLDVWKLLDDAHGLVVNLHDKI